MAFTLCLILTVIFLCVVNSGKLPKGRIYRTFWMTLPGLGWPLFSPVHLQIAFLSLVFVGLAFFFNWSKRGVLVGTLLIAFAVYAVEIPKEFRELTDLQRRFPSEDLTKRLAYEAFRPDIDAKPEMGTEASFWFSKRDEPVRSRGDFLHDRHFRGLEQLHDSSVSWFLESPRFGFSRMPFRPSLEMFKPAEPRPSISLPCSLLDPSDTSETVEQQKHLASPPLPFQELHHQSQLDFLNPSLWGSYRDRTRIFVFRGHAMSKVPEATETAWRIRRIELVSLLKGEEPGVYLTEHLPKMDELREAKTRPLDRFEREALSRLREGHELVQRPSGNQLRMFGAIRANTQCQDCHYGRRGSLLGAFSYELEPQ